MISIIDDKYYDRSWCCTEVKMMQTLRHAYNIHLWYEDVHDPTTGDDYLRPGPMDLEINIADKELTYEADRSELLFLERQTLLLG